MPVNKHHLLVGAYKQKLVGQPEVVGEADYGRVNG